MLNYCGFHADVQYIYLTTLYQDFNCNHLLNTLLHLDALKNND